MILPYFAEGSKVTTTAAVRKPFVDMTAAMIAQFGAQIETEDNAFRKTEHLRRNRDLHCRARHFSGQLLFRPAYGRGWLAPHSQNRSVSLQGDAVLSE